MTPVLGIIASSNQQGRSVGNFSNYDDIASFTVPTGGVASFSFAGVPLGYRTLELHWTMATSVADRDLNLTFNDDTNNNYNNFIMYAGTTGNVLSYTLVGQPKIIWGGGTCEINKWAAGTLTIYNNTNPNAYKDTHAVYGYSYNGSSMGSSGVSGVSHSTGTWASYNAITKLTFSVTSGVINAGSTFTLCGVR